MIVKNGSQSFLAPLVTQERRGPMFRHDPGCMRPASKTDRPALRILEDALLRASPFDFIWTTGMCLVFDNRRMLHSRAVSSIADSDRLLERAYVVRKEGLD